MSKRFSRRGFLAGAGAAFAGGMLVPTDLFANGSPNDKINFGMIGVGGRGRAHLGGFKGENFVAFCDVDSNILGKAVKSFPDAKTYGDYRRMIESEKLDAVSICTPDHIHAVAADMAMEHGMHVYCEKPLTHSIYEARHLTKKAKAKKLVTQMGNQGHSNRGTREVREIIRGGVIGEVREVHCWTDRPIWPQGLDRPPAMPVPANLDWENWIGPAPFRDYHDSLHRFKWRGWWDFGTGALGDMACHIMDSAFFSLDLGYPVSVEAEGAPIKPECAPNWEVVRIEFPARGEMPPVKVIWYDGKKDGKPNRPSGEVTEGLNISRMKMGGSIFVGSKGRLLTSCYSDNWRLFPQEDFEDYTPPEIPKRATHHQDFTDGIRNGTRPCSNFEYAGPFTEMVLIGVIALRVGEKLNWDGENMKAKNCPKADAFIRREYRKGHQLI